MTVISVDLSNRPYDIHVRAGLLADVGAVLTPYARNGRMLVVTDENVAQAVLPKFEATLRGAVLRAQPSHSQQAKREKAGRN